MDNLDRHAYLSLATFRKNGAEVRTPVWFARDGARLFVMSAGQAGKVKRVRNSPRSRIAPCDLRGGVTGDWLDTETFLVTDRAAVELAHRRLREKYGWQMLLADWGAWLARRIEKRAYLEIKRSAAPASG